MLGIDDRNVHWWILGATAGVLGLTVLDETIVGVALLTIRSDLAMTEVASHWVVNAYLLTFTCFVAVGGRLGDAFGHPRLFVTGAVIFGFASLACGLAADGVGLIAARAVQGVGAAVIFPAALAMITNVFPLEQRGLALGIQTTVAAVFMALGPLLGGLLTEIVSWRWIFWINLPVVVGVTLVVLAARLPRATAQTPESGLPDQMSVYTIEYRGLVTLVVALSALVVGLMQGAEWGWTASATLALLVAGIVLLALFALVEARTEQPLIQIGLLRNATFTGGNLTFFTFQFNKMAVFVFIALYFREILHKSPIVAGAAVFVAVLPTLVTSLMAGRCADRFGARMPLLPALLVNGVALCLIGITTAFDAFGAIIALLVIWGASLPFLAIPARRALMSAVPPHQRGQASGVNLTIQMLGGTVGIAVCGALLLATDDYRSVFLATGALTVATMLCVWLLIDRKN